MTLSNNKHQATDQMHKAKSAYPDHGFTGYRQPTGPTISTPAYTARRVLPSTSAAHEN
jgi:hypothetical protein